jgi:hypothetical protein
MGEIESIVFLGDAYLPAADHGVLRNFGLSVLALVTNTR